MKYPITLSQSWRKWLAGILAVVMAIALSGCNPAEMRTQAADVPQIVVSVTTDPDTFNY
ncbi:hypothetical protein IQ272_33150, partial [Chroococcidiopsidales cyanobacterium LEGE 13417]|nr:hypothetical protein [Chroococcidiopsidales cyanobacterium LEGE 13417]